MKSFLKLLSISILFVSLLVLPLQAAGTIKIGVVLPITGPVATFGLSCTNGIKLAVEEINARGGVLGSKIELVIEDDQYKPEEAANATRKLIERDKVVALIGEATSSITLVVAPIAQQSKVVLLTPTATSPKVTQVGDYIFRTCFIDDFQGEVMANFIYKNLKKKTAAIFTAVTSDYSRGLASAFKQKFISLGGKIVAEESYSEGDSDFRAQLTKIKAAKPDFVYLPGYYSDIGPILLQARELGITVPFGGGDGWDSPILVQTAGKTAEGCFFTNHYSPESKDPVVRTFVNNYSKKYGSTPESFGALGYDSLKLLADAIKRAGSTESAKIRDALAATKGFKGVSGTITFDSNRNPIKSAAIIEIKEGKQVYKATVQP
ncbi:MAG TPA: ABC transporter substrate-binding protein [Dictyoglomaceae bacterium]|nr:ABC transporter substrate-binding protein [Dictyoglomaceae bacterium]HOL39542.1 ABC transporter substrate-binding protein [Dictyoglomaceae bacterium]HOP94665.1 ABC transporter substrate-binding protein [Dictyoglomaceae bacterium]HPP16079.1 ABC transporter substrate-binding protein [Dictyoglomaceae bacterium]HPU43014.1 ABC transporter substrate-binding protein [Dictyoglomaceae bacterium]